MRWLVYILSGAVALLLLLYAAINLPPVQRGLASYIESAASDDTQHLRITGLSGHLPFNVGAARIEMADSNGAWLTVEEAHLAWRPFAALFGSYDIKELTAKRVVLSRIPQGTESEETESSGFSIPDIRLGKVAIDDMSLPESLTAGVKTRLRVTMQGGAAQYNGRIETIEGRSTTLSFDATWQEALELKAGLQEEPGGLLASLMELPPAQQLSGEMHITGSVKQFDGTLVLHSAETALANATFSRQADNVTVDAKGTLAGSWQEAAALPSTDWQLQMQATRDVSFWKLANTELQLGDVVLALSGGIDPEAMRFESVVAALAIPDVKPWSEAVGEEMQGALMLKAQLDGAMDDTAIAASAQSDMLTIDGTLLESLAAESSMNTSLQDWIDNGWASAEVKVDLAASIDDEAVKLQAEGETTSGKQIVLSSLTVTTEQGSAQGNLTYDMETETLQARLESKQLALAPLTGNGISGLADLVVSADGGLDDLAISGEGTIGDLGGLPEPVNEWAGTDATLSLDANYQPKELALNQLELISGTLTMKAKGAVALSDDTAPVPLTIDATREGFAPIHAELAIVSGESVLRFPQAVLTTKGTRITADGLAIAQDSGLASGECKLVSDDIGPLALWAGLEASGKAQAVLKLNAADGKQAAELNGSLSQIAMPDLTVETVTLAASIDDLAALNGVNANVSLREMQASGLTVTEATLAAKQPTQQEPVFVATTLSGVLGATPFTVQTDGTYQEAMTSVLALNALEARYGDYPVTLVQPVTFNWNTSEFTMDELAVKIARGSFTANGSLQHNKADITARLERLPLRPLFTQSSPYMPDAWLDADLKLTGDARQPVMTVESVVKTAGTEAVPSLEIATNATLQNNKLDATVVATSGGKLGQGEFHMPVSLSLQPVAFALAPDAPLDGTFALNADLARFNDWLAAMGHKLEGTAQADMRISGTLEYPQADGTIRWADGGYEHLRYGMCLRSITMDAALESDRLRIGKMHATGDQGKGTLDGSGHLAFGDAASDINLKMSQLQMFCSGVAEGMIDGALHVTDTAIAGALEVGPLNIALPASGAESIASVETVRKQDWQKQEEVQQQEGGPSLDIAVNMPGRIFVRGRGVDAEFSGNMRVAGTASKPRIGGKLSTERGQFDLLGSTLTIQKGSLHFLGEEPDKPYLDMAATSDVDGVTVQAGLTGLVKNPELTLSSSPSLPQDEILARLLFGRALGNVTPFQALQLAQAAAVLAGESSGPGALGAVRNLIGVDTLSVNQTDDGDPSVGAGKYISDRVFIGVEQGATPESRKIKTEIELTPNISAETSTDAQGRPGGALEWRYDY